MCVMCSVAEHEGERRGEDSGIQTVAGCEGGMQVLVFDECGTQRQPELVPGVIYFYFTRASEGQRRF